MTESDRQAGPSRDRAPVPLAGKLGAFLAAIVMFLCVLLLGGGFGSALVEMLGLAGSAVWVSSGLALFLALLSSIWLFRRALSVEQESADQPFGKRRRS